MLRYSQWTRCLEWNSARPPEQRVSIDHFPKSCGPPEYPYHLRSIKRLKIKKLSTLIDRRTGKLYRRIAKRCVLHGQKLPESGSPETLPNVHVGGVYISDLSHFTACPMIMTGHVGIHLCQHVTA